MTTIEKIHAEFDSAQDRLLSEALAILSQKNNDLVSMYERLKAIGFANTPIAKSGEQTKEKLVKSTEQAELIQYYQQTYPFLKFLTEEELDRICAKYKLIYAPVANYVKDVPEKNLRDIEAAQKLKDMDMCPSRYFFTGEAYLDAPKAFRRALRNGLEIPGSCVFYNTYRKSIWVSDSELKSYVCKKIGIPTFDGYAYSRGTVTEIKRSGLFIAAPESHFDTKGLEKKGFGLFNAFKTEIKDPIVFRYVRGGIQVLTKWGAEAEDPALILPINN